MQECRCGSTWIMVCHRCYEYTQTYRWIKSDERLPLIKDFILAYDGERIDIIFWDKYSSMDEWCNLTELEDGSNRQKPFTHWMPLPHVPRSNDTQTENKVLLGPATSYSTPRAIITDSKNAI